MKRWFLSRVVADVRVSGFRIFEVDGPRVQRFRLRGWDFPPYTNGPEREIIVPLRWNISTSEV